MQKFEISEKLLDTIADALFNTEANKLPQDQNVYSCLEDGFEIEYQKNEKNRFFEAVLRIALRLEDRIICLYWDPETHIMQNYGIIDEISSYKFDKNSSIFHFSKTPKNDNSDLIRGLDYSW